MHKTYILKPKPEYLRSDGTIDPVRVGAAVAAWRSRKAAKLLTRDSAQTLETRDAIPRPSTFDASARTIEAVDRVIDAGPAPRCRRAVPRNSRSGWPRHRGDRVVLPCSTAINVMASTTYSARSTACASKAGK